MKRLLTVLVSLGLAIALALPAAAHALPDLDRSCSVTVTLQCDGKAVSGGTMTLHRVGDVVEENGDYTFTLSPDFQGSGISLNTLGATTAQALADYAAKKDFAGTTASIGSKGTVRFSGLEAGLYLLVQEQAAKGYEPAQPFLVSLPYYDESQGAYLYDLDTLPKVSLELDPVPTPTTQPVGDKVAQTGQLNWPVPVLVIVGLGLLSLGWLLTYGGKRSKDET